MIDNSGPSFGAIAATALLLMTGAGLIRGLADPILRQPMMLGLVLGSAALAIGVVIFLRACSVVSSDEKGGKETDGS